MYRRIPFNVNLLRNLSPEELAEICSVRGHRQNHTNPIHGYQESMFNSDGEYSAREEEESSSEEQTPSPEPPALPQPTIPVFPHSTTDLNTLYIDVYHDFVPGRVLSIEDVFRTPDNLIVVRYINQNYTIQVAEVCILPHRFVYVELWNRKKSLEISSTENLVDYTLFELIGENYFRQPMAMMMNLTYIKFISFEMYNLEFDRENEIEGENTPMDTS